MEQKIYWKGEDIDSLPRETLIEIIHHLNHRLDVSRQTTKSIIEINRLARARR